MDGGNLVSVTVQNFNDTNCCWRDSIKIKNDFLEVRGLAAEAQLLNMSGSMLHVITFQLPPFAMEGMVQIHIDGVPEVDFAFVTGCDYSGSRTGLSFCRSKGMSF